VQAVRLFARVLIAPTRPIVSFQTPLYLSLSCIFRICLR
jgi:hypothetical protein